MYFKLLRFVGKNKEPYGIYLIQSRLKQSTVPFLLPVNTSNENNITLYHKSLMQTQCQKPPPPPLLTVYTGVNRILLLEKN